MATKDQRLALITSLRGCTRPGCDAPASMCAMHHVKDYSKGGTTDIDNLVWACDHCHALIKDGEDGWKTLVLDENSRHPGRVAWIAPEHIDPTRTPRVNHRHFPGELLAETLLNVYHQRAHARDEHKRWLRKRFGDKAA